MKIVIRRSENSIYGYEFVSIENGIENIVPLNRKTPDECLYLPENPMNRKYISISKLEKSGGYLELISKTGIEDYLSEEDRILYLSLIEKAQKEKKRREEELKNLDPKEKLRRQIEEMMKKLENME